VRNLIKKKPEIRVTIDIKHGGVTPAQGQAWREFWQRLISDAKGQKSKLTPR